MGTWSACGPRGGEPETLTAAVTSVTYWIILYSSLLVAVFCWVLHSWLRKWVIKLWFTLCSYRRFTQLLCKLGLFSWFSCPASRLVVTQQPEHWRARGKVTYKMQICSPQMRFLNLAPPPRKVPSEDPLSDLGLQKFDYYWLVSNFHSLFKVTILCWAALCIRSVCARVCVCMWCVCGGMNIRESIRSTSWISHYHLLSFYFFFTFSFPFFLMNLDVFGDSKLGWRESELKIILRG